MRRKGRRIINQYLFSLGVFALFGIAIGAALYVVARYVVPTPLSPPPSFNTIFGGYGCIIGGAMVGAWLSVAAGRREVSFDGIPDFLNYGYEPAIRMGFVAVLASVLGLFVQLKILSLSLGNNNLANFILPNQEALAIGIGVIAGIGERALSVQLIERAQNVLSPGKL